MPKASPTGIRLSAETKAEIEVLAALWGPIEPLKISAVIRVAITRAYEAERDSRKAKSPAPALRAKS
jgi:hypothetical protein